MGFIDNSGDGTPVVIPSGQKLSVPGGMLTVLQLTNPATVRKLTSVRLSCSSESKVEILDDGSVIGSGRTGPAEPNFRFDYPKLPVTPGAELLVRISTCPDTAETDVEGYVIAEDE